MGPVWRALAGLPQRDAGKEWTERASALGFYLPLSEPRGIPVGADIHPSVWERRKATGYAPENLPHPPPD